MASVVAAATDVAGYVYAADTPARVSTVARIASASLSLNRCICSVMV
jgi:hypothetical protein